jgi:hypothetical protein
VGPVTSIDRPNGPQDEHVRALARLDAASLERDRLHGQQQAAGDEAAKLEAQASLYTANEQVTARERWLQWVEERED